MAALKALAGEVAVQADGHTDTLLPHMEEEHRPQKAKLELRTVDVGENNKCGELHEPDRREGRAWQVHQVHTAISFTFHYYCFLLVKSCNVMEEQV